jgi:hypothetical protein
MESIDGENQLTFDGAQLKRQSIVFFRIADLAIKDKPFSISLSGRCLTSSNGDQRIAAK